MNDRLISAKEAKTKMGLPTSTFWDVIADEKIERVEYTPKCIRFWESKIDALIVRRTVKSPADRTRLADARRRS